MIHLNKLAAPDVLRRHAAEWTAELLAAIQRGTNLSEARKRRYNTPGIKERLLTETHAKCAYCESKLTHVTYGDIEHITPKSSARERTYEWENLTIACDICNTNKGDQEGVIDPYQVDPETVHFRFMGPMVTIRGDSEPGKLTLTLLQLNRPPLMEIRKERIEDLGRRLREILKTQDEVTRTVLAKALINGETDASKEFAACARAFVHDKERDGELVAL
jgi:uncharacterized protein (TIGR02646 family)